MKNKQKLTIYTIVYIVTVILMLALMIDGIASRNMSGLFWLFFMFASTCAYFYLRKKYV